MPNQNTKGMGVSFVILEKIQDDLKDHESLVPIRVSLYGGGGGGGGQHICTLVCGKSCPLLPDLTFWVD